MNAINNPPLVAIRCVTYNHEPYIRDTLNGFVMQKTNFPFIAIVHDDASTDGTADVIQEYAAKYPYSHLKNRMAISKYLGKDFVEVDKCRFSWKLLPSIKKIFVDFPEHFKFVCRMFWFAPGTCIKECLREIRYKIFHK